MQVLLHSTGSFAPGAPLGISKTLRVGIAGTVEELDPRAGVTGATALVLGQIFEPPSVLLEPLRAEDDEHLLFSAAVQQEIRFSDGTLLSAELAARSLRGARALAGKAAVDVRGNRVWFRLAVPNPRFALTLQHHACAIVLDRNDQLHGTGPFMFDQRPKLRMLELSPCIRLVRNPYYRSITAIQEVRFSVFPPDADGVPRKLLYALRQESIDLTTAVDPYAQVPGLAPVIQPGNSTAMLFFNTVRPPMSSLDMRRGIAAAIDRRQLAFACYDRNSDAFAAESVLPPSMDDRGTPGLAHDLDAAKSLLSKFRTRLTLLVPPGPRSYLPKPSAVASALQGQLAHAGVSVVVLEAQSEGEYGAALANGTYDLALGGCIAETPDPADFLGKLRAMCGDMNLDELPCTPLIHGHATVVHARHLQNVVIAPDGFLSLADVKL